jgi:hypothetical protein
VSLIVRLETTITFIIIIWSKKMKKEINALLNEKVFSIDNVNSDRDGIKNEEYSALGTVVKGFAWSLGNTIKNKEEFLQTQLVKLKGMLESPYVGSDVHNNSIENKEMYITNLQVTIDELEEFKDVVLKRHQDLFGSEYVPYKKGAKVTDTASTLSAKAMLDKYGI